MSSTVALVLSACSGHDLASDRSPSREPVTWDPTREIEDVVNRHGRTTREATARPEQPPGAVEVALRALVLRSVAQAGFFPRSGEVADPNQLRFFEAERNQMVNWLIREGVWETATRQEKVILSAPVGSMERRKVESLQGGREALLVMIWALDPRVEFPSCDNTGPSLHSLGARLPEVSSSTGNFLAQATLRPREEIEVIREAAWIWHWRAQAQEIMNREDYPRGESLDTQVQDLEEKARAEGIQLEPIRDGKTFFRELIRFVSLYYCEKLGLLPSPIGADFPAFQQSYRDLTPRQFRILRDTASRRHYALNWLLGYAENNDWAAVPSNP